VVEVGAADKPVVYKKILVAPGFLGRFRFPTKPVMFR
jgi:hypothetical protein